MAPNGHIPDYAGMLWATFGVLIFIGAISMIPVVGKPIAFVIVLAVIVGWIVSLFVKGLRR